MFEVEIYSDRRGCEPITELLRDLRERSKTSKEDKIRYEKIFTYIRVLEEHGTRAGLPYVKHIGDGIWELRPANDRILFFYFKDDKTFVLLHQFKKKTQKTPIKEINQAKRNMKDHIERSI